MSSGEYLTFILSKDTAFLLCIWQNLTWVVWCNCTKLDSAKDLVECFDISHNIFQLLENISKSHSNFIDDNYIGIYGAFSCSVIKETQDFYP